MIGEIDMIVRFINWLSKYIKINKEDGNIFIFANMKVKRANLKNCFIISSKIDIEE